MPLRAPHSRSIPSHTSSGATPRVTAGWPEGTPASHWAGATRAGDLCGCPVPQGPEAEAAHTQTPRAPRVRLGLGGPRLPDGGEGVDGRRPASGPLAGCGEGHRRAALLSFRAAQEP